MSKSILVIDTPEFCAECPGCDDLGEVCRAIDKPITDVNGECEKPDWCPLVKLPEEKPCKAMGKWLNFNCGYNTCIDEILKGANKNE